MLEVGKSNSRYALNQKFYSGFPAPEITAVIIAKKEGSEPTEMKLGPYVEHFDWILNSFASEVRKAHPPLTRLCFMITYCAKIPPNTVLTRNTTK